MLNPKLKPKKMEPAFLTEKRNTKIRSIIIIVSSLLFVGYMLLS